MGWLVFVVSGVLAAPPALALALSGDVAVAYLWLVVSASLFRPSPERVLRLSLRSVLVGGRVVAGRGRRVLSSRASGRSVTSLVRARDDVTQAALTADAQVSPPSDDTADDTAGADARRPGSHARARLIDLHLAVDEVGHATAALARSAPPPALVAAADAVLLTLHRGGDGTSSACAGLATAAACAAAAPSTAATALRVSANDLAAFLRGDRSVLEPGASIPPVRPWTPLAGSAAVLAATPAPPGLSRASLRSRISSARPATRQAVQVGLAVGITIALAYLVSPRYYFWAVIAAFVVYGGTTTRGETAVKAVARVGGTLTGLVVGFAIAQVFGAGLVVVVVVVLLAFPASLYWRVRAFGISTFAISTAIPVLFDALHRPLVASLELRVVETVIGAVVATVVALLVLPTRTQDVTRSAQERFGAAMADLMEACADALWSRDRGVGSRLDAATRVLDARLNELTTVVRPTVHPLVVGSVAGPARLMVRLHASAASAARGLASGVRTAIPTAPTADLAAACREVAAAVRRGAVPESVPERAAAFEDVACDGDDPDDTSAELWRDVRRVATAVTVLATMRTEADGKEPRREP